MEEVYWELPYRIFYEINSNMEPGTLSQVLFLDLCKHLTPLTTRLIWVDFFALMYPSLY